MTFTEKAFNLLASNLGLPYYQAERRIDIFINVFLEDIVHQHTPFIDAQYILAEFPLKKKEDSDHSAHIDYLMFSPGDKIVFFVELKTDEKSFDLSQVEFYESKSKFIEWYRDFEKIKMKGFKTKKKFATDVIEKKLGKDIGEYACAVIIIKPLQEKEELKKDGRHFIALKNIEIKTEYQDEWEKLKTIVLSKILE